MEGLIGDIGGTWTRFGRVEADGSVAGIEVRPCADFPGLEEALDAYLAGAGHRPRRPGRAAFSVACPITGDRVKLTNYRWSFSIEALRARFGFETLEVINDFAAVARGVPHLRPEHLVRIGGGRPAAGAAVAVLGPGTGLGVSGLVPSGRGWAVIEGEGGHVTMPARNDREAGVLADLRRELGHVSAERVLSGPGLVDLHGALCRLGGEPPDPDLTPQDIVDAGLEARAPRCAEALDLAAEMLGTFASDVALTLGARGGVYIGGGLVPRYAPRFAGSGFRRRFEDKGRFSGYLAAIPTWLILHEVPAFLGLAALVREPHARPRGSAPG